MVTEAEQRPDWTNLFLNKISSQAYMEEVCWSVKIDDWLESALLSNRIHMGQDMYLPFVTPLL